MPTEVAPQHLFVFGCERSGTSLLVRLLHAHPDVVLGMERYKYVIRDMRVRRKYDLLRPEHFEADRFLDFRPEDSNVIPPNHAEHYDRARQRLERGPPRYIGDKILPPDQLVMAGVLRRFPAARFVFIYRDLPRVASSFEARAADPDDEWPAENGWEYGRRHWLEALGCARLVRYKTGAHQLFIVRCERLFEGDPSTCAALLDFLDLAPSPEVDACLAERSAEWLRRQQKPLRLSPAELDTLSRRRDGWRTALLDRRFERQLTAAADLRNRGR